MIPFTAYQDGDLLESIITIRINGKIEQYQVLESCLEYNFNALDLKSMMEDKMKDNLTQFSINLSNSSNDSREFGLNIKLEQSKNNNC